MKKTGVLAGAIIAAQLLHAAYRPDRFIEATPWNVRNVGIVIDVPCCDMKDVQSATQKVANHGRGIVRLAPGTYMADAPLNIATPVSGGSLTIEGDGALIQQGVRPQ